MYGYSVDSVAGRIIACTESSCYELTMAGWEHMQDTLYPRESHTSAVVS